VRALAYRFLDSHGTRFQATEPTYSNHQICEMYAEAALNRAGYKGMMSTGPKQKLSGGLEDRQIRAEAANYVSADAKYFINEHHRMCFQVSAPEVYNYFFTHAVANPQHKATTAYRASDHWGQTFQQFYQGFPKSCELLSTVYLLDRQGGVGSPALWRVSGPGVGATGLALMPGAGAVLQPLL